MHQHGAEIESLKLQQSVREFQNSKNQQPVGEFPSPFACVPGGHHIAIISKCKSVKSLRSKIQL